MKVKCIYEGDTKGWFTKGKIYEFIDNGIIDDEGDKWDDYKDIEDFNRQQTPQFELV